MPDPNQVDGAPPLPALSLGGGDGLLSPVRDRDRVRVRVRVTLHPTPYTLHANPNPNPNPNPSQVALSALLTPSGSGFSVEP